MKIKVGIVGSRNLSCLITRWILTQDNIEIVGVVAPPFNGWWNDELKTVCEELSIKTFDSIENLANVKPEIIFSINYWKKIDKDYIKSIPRGIVNIHHSYLLKYKGRYSTSWAIANARKLNCWVHGTTLHYIDENLDQGKIIASYKCEIKEEDTAESLFEKVEDLALVMFKENFSKIVNNEISTYLNEDEKSFYYDIDSNKNLEVSFDQKPEEILDFVRAWSFKDRPKPYFFINGQKIFLSLT